METTLPSVKEEVLKILDSLPDGADWEEIHYSIYARERVERARREVADGRVLDQEEVEARMQRWLSE